MVSYDFHLLHHSAFHTELSSFLPHSTNVCMSCGVTFAEWHCPKCNLWMDLKKKPFHCDKCGICRVGGSDKFRHCEMCCMCISVAMLETHNCMKDKYKSKIFSVDSTECRIIIMLFWLFTFGTFYLFGSKLSSMSRGYVFVQTKPTGVAVWTCYSCEGNFELTAMLAIAQYLSTDFNYLLLQ